jgi:hypothetical protein
MLKNKLKNQSGQALIESLALSAALVAALSGLGAIIYFALVHLGVNYLLHEFLVCEVTQGANQCQHDFQKKTRTFLFAGKLTDFVSTKTPNKQIVRVTLKLPMNRSLTMQKELEPYR